MKRSRATNDLVCENGTATSIGPSKWITSRSGPEYSEHKEPKRKYLCRTMYGYVGLSRAMYGYLWLCMAMFAYVWPCMVM